MISRQNTTMAKMLELMDSFNLIIVQMYKVFIYAPCSKILEKKIIDLHRGNCDFCVGSMCIIFDARNRANQLPVELNNIT